MTVVPSGARIVLRTIGVQGAAGDPATPGGVTTPMLADDAVTPPKLDRAYVELSDPRLSDTRQPPPGTVVGQVLIWNGSAWVPRATTATPTYDDLAAGRVITA